MVVYRWVTVGSKSSVFVTEDSFSLAADYFDMFRPGQIGPPGRLCQHNFKHHRLAILVRIMLE